MSKQQKLRNTAEGLLAGLAAVGFQGPWTWAHHQWEGAFYRAWRSWTPAKNREVFHTLAIGGSADGRTSQAREILFAVKSTSPFSGYRDGPLNDHPFGLTPDEYLEDHVVGATPEQWKELAQAFLSEMQEAR